ncbi:hypothetical protein GCM10010271_55710 [Streptomyces kurssanovii]|nr:hypothetical protein GCM10010271_55710 [Streptomyces kurssanovii]
MESRGDDAVRYATLAGAYWLDTPTAEAREHTPDRHARGSRVMLLTTAAASVLIAVVLGIGGRLG